MNNDEINKAFDEEYIKYRAAFPKDYDIPTYFTSKHAVSMTLRDYFAAKAVQGLLASEVNAPLNAFATKAYAVADAMMEARNAAQ